MAEVEEASRAFVDDVLESEPDTSSTHEELERGAPLAGRVHPARRDAPRARRLLLARLDAELPDLDLDRDFHVRLADGRRAFTATV